MSNSANCSHAIAVPKGEAGPELTIVMFGYNHEAIAALEGTGVSVIVAEEPTLYAAKGLAARSAALSNILRWHWCEYQRGTADAVRVLAEIMATTHVDGVVPGLEYAVEAANAAAESQGLKFAGSGVAATLTSKIRLRERVGGVEWRQVYREEDLLDPPFVLKPADRQASVGVSIVRTEAEKAGAWEATVTAEEPRQLAGRDWERTFICERLLEGQEKSVECLMVDGTPVFTNVTFKETSGAVELGHIVADDDPELVAAMHALMRDLGVETGLFHAEFKGDTLIECAGRPPGDRIAMLVSAAWNINLYLQWVYALCGREVTVPATPRTRAAIRFLYPPAGVLHQVADPSGRAVISVKPGQLLHPVRSSWDRAGYVEGTDVAAVVRDASQVSFDVSDEVLLIVGHRRSPVEYRPIFQAARGAVIITDAPDMPADIPVVEKLVPETYDLASVLPMVHELATRYQIAGVATFGDRDVEMAAAIAAELGLPGPSPEAAWKARNKLAMRNAVAAVDPTLVPRFRQVTTEEELAAAQEMCLPLVLKPVDASGSKGVSICDTWEEVQAAWDAWPGPMMVEEVLTGTEHSVEGYVVQGRVHIIGVTDKTTTDRHRLEIGQRFPSAIPNACEIVAPLVAATVAATGIDNCAFHLECFINDGSAKLVEIAARSGGDYIASHLVPSVTGQSFQGDVLKIVAGRRPSFATPRAGYVAATLKLHTEGQGTLTRFDPLPESPIVVSAQRLREVGDTIVQPPADTLSSILAEVIVVAATAKEIDAFEQQLRATVVEVRP